MAKRHRGVTPLGKGRYRVRTEVRHPKTGRVHEIDRVVQAPTGEAAAKLLASVRAEWIKKRSRGAGPDGRRRLADAMRAWLLEKKPTIKVSTASTYETSVEWWCAVLGDYWLDSIEPRDVREALEGSTRSSETRSGRLRVLRTFAKEEKCATICEGVKVKADVREVERREEVGRGLSLDELRRLLDKGPRAWVKLDGEVMPAWRRAWALLATMAWTGLRFGEASALEWQDIDLEMRLIRVRRAQWRGKVDHPKAVASKRVVIIPEELADTLAEHRHAMLAGQQTGVASGLVFPTRRKSSTSAYVTNGHAGKAMLRACKAAGIDLGDRPWVHCLRHSFNNLLRPNAPELVRQALIGHADASQNARYSVVGLDEKRRAVGTVVGLIRGGE